MSREKKKKEIKAPKKAKLLDSSEHLLKTCEREREEYLNGWKRAKADLINYQADEARRTESSLRTAREDCLVDLLPVLESFDLFGQALDKGEEGSKGFMSVRSQLSEVLKRQGLEEIKTRPGETFDPSRHESIGEVESEAPAGTIAEEVRKGYTMQGKTLRATQVRLSKEK